MTTSAIKALADARQFDEAEAAAREILRAAGDRDAALKQFARHAFTILQMRRRYGLGAAGAAATRHVEASDRLAGDAVACLRIVAERSPDDDATPYLVAHGCSLLRDAQGARTAWRQGLANLEARRDSWTGAGLPQAFTGAPGGHPPRTPEELTREQGVVALAGYPKSGNVWLTTLLAHLFNHEVEMIESWSRIEKFAVSFTHFGLTHEMITEMKVLRGGFIIRDLRDVIVSLFHFMKTPHFVGQFGNEVPDYSNIEDMYFDYFLPSFAPQNELETLADGYAIHQWPVLRYENMKVNPLEELRHFLTQWGIVVDDGRLAGLLATHTIEKLRNGETRTLAIAGASHFRRGAAGDFRTVLPVGVLADIDAKFGEYLQKWSASRDAGAPK